MRHFWIFVFLFPTLGFALTFKEATILVQQHDLLKVSQHKEQAIAELARVKGSWGDPKLHLKMKNFPKESLKDDQTPMSGIELGFSQKMALTNKYSHLENASLAMARSAQYDGKNLEAKLMMLLWQVLIEDRKLIEEISVLSESSLWLKKNLKVSNKLYANGKISQQALLEIQIRNSELEVNIYNKKKEREKLKDRLNYLIDRDDITNIKDIPWPLLDQKRGGLQDFQALALKEKFKAKKSMLIVAKKSFIPDFTLSIGYTKRADIDGHGDFISAGISMPLPFSSSKYANYSKSVNENYQVQKELDHYEKKKKENIASLEKDIDMLSYEYQYLVDKIIKFAKSARTITSKSYGLGRASYIELLQSELKLQNILMRKAQLKSNLSMKKLSLKYLTGETLYE